MSRDLMSQINSRADSMRNINDMANDSRGGFFGDFKNTITNDYQGALEDYAGKMNFDVSKEIASRSESFGILSQTPTLYASGKVGYSTLGPKGKKPFDIVGRAVKRRFGKTIEGVDKQVKSFQSNVKNFPEHIKNVMSGAEEVQEPIVITRADGTTSNKLLDVASRERGMGRGGNIELTNLNPDNELTNIDKPIRFIGNDELPPLEDIEPTQEPILDGYDPRERISGNLKEDSYPTNIDARRTRSDIPEPTDITGDEPDEMDKNIDIAVDRVKTADADWRTWDVSKYAENNENFDNVRGTKIETPSNSNVMRGDPESLLDSSSKIDSPESTETTEATKTDENVMTSESKIITKSPSAETEGSNISKDLTAAAEGDEDVMEGAAAVPVVGEVGEAVAGVGLALIGVVAGLTTLFSHHSHHPNRPTYNATQPAFQSRYNPSASVLANVNNTTNQATMSF